MFFGRRAHSVLFIIHVDRDKVNYNIGQDKSRI